MEAVVWTLAGDGGSQVLRLVSSYIMTRLLFPEAFGVMFIVSIVLQGLQMFSDVGIHPVIVQHSRGDDPVFLNTAWTIQAIRGTILWLGTVAVAWPLSRMYHQPQLLYLLPASGLNCLLDGFTSTHMVTADRHLSLGRLTILNFGTGLLGLVVRVAWAATVPTIWALVGGSLVHTTAKVVLSHVVFSGPRNRFLWDPEAVKVLVGFGRWVFLSTLTTFIAMQADKLVFAKMIPIALYGVYSLGTQLARLPQDTIMKIASAVAFPAYSRVRDREGHFRSVYMRVRAPLLLAGGAGLGFLTLMGPAVVRILFDDRYHDAGWMLQLIALGTWFQLLEATNATALLALGMPKWLAAGNVAKILCMGVALPLGYRWMGFPGALIAMALVEIPRFLIEAVQIRAHGLKAWGFEIASTLAVCGCAAVALALHHWHPPAGRAWLELSVALACFLALWVPLGLWVRRIVWKES